METVRRPAREDEKLVMQTFVKHARHCHDCANPLKTYKDGGYLCDRGHAYAQDIAEYLYLKAGVMFSKYDQTRDYMPMQVETPAGFEVVRDLLRVLDNSLKKRRPAPVISHDKNYYAPDRRSYPPDNLYDHEVIEVEPRRQHEVRRHKSEKKKKAAYVPGRGSLYRQDEKDRKQRQEEEPVIVYAAPTRSRYKEHR
ncbi:MAG: hypothetical protein Q9160_005668 [Pyrenula sp. 1 TL-2023]